jgi:urease accessory protein
MIIEEIVGNINDLDTAEIEKYHQEKVFLESADLVKRIQRVETDHGRELGIRLKTDRI